MATIVLVSMVKNESAILETMIRNVKPIVDAVCILDTGSDDGTQEIIRRYGPVHETPFVNFVETKNRALALARNVADYVLFLDADETVVTGLDRLKAHADAGVGAVSAMIVEGQPPYTRYHRPRLWRNDGTYKFEGPNVHEVCCGPGPWVYDNGIEVKHDHAHRTPESYEPRFRLYLQLLSDWLKEHPADTRARFYFARTLKDLGEHLPAIEAYRDYLALPDTFVDQRWQAAYDIALCYKANGEAVQAWAALTEAEKIDPRRAEMDCLRGHMAWNAQEYPTAIKCFASAALKPVPQDVLLFQNVASHTEEPLDMLTLCYDKTRDYRKGSEVCAKLNEIRSYKDERIRRNCDWLVNVARKKVFLCLGITPEPVYAGMMAEVGVGGVETTYIELADCLAALGHEVFLFSRCEVERVAGHVRYIPYERMMEFADVKPDVIVTSRWFDAMYQFPTAKKIVWLQDAHYADPNHADAWQVADLIVCSSPWHRDYILERHGPGMPRSKLVVQPLGIRKAQFEGIDESQRDPLRVIYSSNPDRGLEQLGAMWPEITRRVPGIHLVVTYGWEGLKTWGQDAEWQAHVDAKRARILGLFDGHDNVRFTGRLKKSDLYAEMKRCTLCLYPNTFWETYCLSSLECQAAGVPMVTSKIGALATTCNVRANVLLEGNPYGQAYAARFVAEVEDLLVTHPERLAVLREQALAHVKESPCDWMDVARRWERVIWMLQ